MYTTLSGFAVGPFHSHCLCPTILSSLFAQSLVQPIIKPDQQQSTVKDTNISQGSNISKPGRREDEVLHASLPERPPATVHPRRFIPTRPRAERDESNEVAASRVRTPVIPSSSKHNVVLDDSPRLSKKPRQSGGGNTDNGPSLLSRMGSSVSNGPKDRVNIGREWQNGSRTEGTVGRLPENDRPEELSILGAASRTMQPSSFTLLDRIEDGDLPITEDDRRRRKKKGKAQR